MTGEMAKVHETAPLLKEEAGLYKGEKEPEEKAPVSAVTKVADGIPYQRPVALSPANMAPLEQWSTGLFNCCYNTPEHLGSDCEICMLGWLAPCVLYGSTRERLQPDDFSSSCCLYNGLYFLSQALVNANCLAPFLSYPTRTAIRQRFNLEGNVPSEGCCCFTSPEQREGLEQSADCLIHFWCHPCALCQEAREVRRRCPHPAPILAPVSTVAPQVQVMGMQK
jgi:Cys-rich protein (TIGR01571 family)